MGKIFYIMGKSASGKDKIYSRLAGNKELNLKKLVLYTTRPIRDGEKDGVQYYFTDERRLQEFETAGKVIESRATIPFMEYGLILQRTTDRLTLRTEIILDRYVRVFSEDEMLLRKRIRHTCLY